MEGNSVEVQTANDLQDEDPSYHYRYEEFFALDSSKHNYLVVDVSSEIYPRTGALYSPYPFVLYATEDNFEALQAAEKNFVPDGKLPLFREEAAAFPGAEGVWLDYKWPRTNVMVLHYPPNGLQNIKGGIRPMRG